MLMPLVTFQADDEFVRALDEFCHKRRINRSDAIRLAIFEFLDKSGQAHTIKAKVKAK